MSPSAANPVTSPSPMSPRSAAVDAAAPRIGLPRRGDTKMAAAQVVPAEISFIGTGDCGPVHGPADGFPIERFTELVRPTLRTVDLRFANCERQYSSRGVANETSPPGRQPPEIARMFMDVGFCAVTIANERR